VSSDGGGVGESDAKGHVVILFELVLYAAPLHPDKGAYHF